MIAEANCPARFWLGPELIVAFKDPQHVEVHQERLPKQKVTISFLENFGLV